MSLETKEVLALVKLSLVNLNSFQLKTLKNKFNSYDEILATKNKDLLEVLKQESGLNELYFSTAKTLTKLEAIDSDDIQKQVDITADWLANSNNYIIDFHSEFYPKFLCQVEKAPYLLYLTGNPEILNEPQISIVGSRNSSNAGIRVAKDFAKFLSNSGLTITSGLATGIDSAAHLGALEGISSTIAIMGTGADRVYPAANLDLAKRIVESNGALISQFPLATQPLPKHFPIRNLLVAAMSYGTLVVEAGLKSGSLITARLAMENNKEVFAIPGSINNPLAAGCHALIKSGAKLVERGVDILEELEILKDLLEDKEGLTLHEDGDRNTPNKQTDKMTAGEDKILKLVEFEPIGFDELIVLSKKSASELQSLLSILELMGKIEKLSANRWVRI